MQQDYPTDNRRLGLWFMVLSANTAIFQLHHGENKLIWNDDDEGRLVLDPHVKLNFHSSSSLKQQSAERHVAPLGYIILIPSQPVFALSHERCVFSGKATYTNFIVFGLTRPGLEPNIYRTWGEHANHYITDAVYITYDYTIKFILSFHRYTGFI